MSNILDFNHKTQMPKNRYPYINVQHKDNYYTIILTTVFIA